MNMKALKKKVHAQKRRVEGEERRGEKERQARAAGKPVKHPSISPGRGKRIMTKYKTNRVAKSVLHGK